MTDSILIMKTTTPVSAINHHEYNFRDSQDDKVYIESSSYNRQLSVEAPSFMEATTPMMKDDAVQGKRIELSASMVVNGSRLDVVDVHSTTVAKTEDHHHDFDCESALRQDASWKQRFQCLLHCRYTERSVIKNAYQRMVKRNNQSRFSELILISGPCGSGKTCLAQKTLQPLAEEAGGFFIRGKFDQLQRPEPFRAFVAAFTQFTKELLRRGDEILIAKIRRNILQSLGHEAGVLTSMIPALRQIVGGEIEETPITGRDAFCQFAHVLHTFMKAVCSPEHPIVLLFDDLHYADPCSLQMLRCLISNAEGGLVIVGTCLDTVSPTSHLSVALRNLEDDNGVKITNISLGKLNPEVLQSIISKTFQRPPEHCKDLADIICCQTNGVMMHTMECMRWLEDEQLLQFRDGLWKWDEDEIMLSIECNRVGDYILDKLERLPLKAQELLKVASCLGSNSNKRLLKVLLDNDLDLLLHKAVERGVLVHHHHEDEFHFSTDGVQRAAYDLIPSDQREAFHLSIGRNLLQKLKKSELEKNIYLVLSQFKIGHSLITDLTEKHAISMICLHAGKTAARSSAFQTAADYLDFGISLLSARRWQGRESDLCLALHNAAAEVAVCCTNFDRVDELIGEILSHTRQPHEKLTAQCTQIYTLGIRDRQVDAIDLGIEVLKTVGVTFPSKLCIFHLNQEFRHSSRKLRGKSDESILRKQGMTDFKMLMAMRIMNIIGLDAMIARPKFFPFISLKMIDMTMKHGLSEHASAAFALYGMLCIGLKGEIDDGYRFGQLALKLLERYKMDEYLPRVYASVYGCIHVFKHPVQETIEPTDRAHKVGHLTGDLEYAALNASLNCFHKFWGGASINEVNENLTEFCSWMESQRQSSALSFAKPCKFLVDVLMGKTKDPFRTDETLTDETSYLQTLLQHAIDTGSEMTITTIAKQKLIIGYMFGHYKEAEEASEHFDHFSGFHPPSLGMMVVLTFKGLTHLGLARKGIKKRKNIHHARCVIKHLKKLAEKSPHNFSDKLFLLEGELASVKGKNDKAFSKFTCAIGMAASSGFTPFHALALERLGWHMYWKSDADLTAASTHLSKACEQYQKWGASAKVDHLRGEIQTLFGNKNFANEADEQGSVEKINSKSSPLRELRTDSTLTAKTSARSLI